jgi:hypothetical protein
VEKTKQRIRVVTFTIYKQSIEILQCLGPKPPTNKPNNLNKPKPPTNKPNNLNKPKSPTNKVPNKPKNTNTKTHPPSPKPTDNWSAPIVKPTENNNGYDIEPVQPVKKEIPSKPPVDKNSNQKPPKEEKAVEVKKPTCSLDVVFVLDVSSSVRTAFEQQKTIAGDIYDHLIQKTGNIHYAIVKFSGTHRSRIVVPMRYFLHTYTFASTYKYCIISQLFLVKTKQASSSGTVWS